MHKRKNLGKLRIQNNFYHVSKTYLRNHRTKNFRCFLRNNKKQTNKQNPLYDTFIVLKVLVDAIRHENKTKVLRLGKKTKLKLFADDIIVYRVNPTESTNHQNAEF